MNTLLLANTGIRTAWPITETTLSLRLEFAEMLGRRILVPVDPDLLLRVQRTAQIRGLSTESLVNLLLEQRMQQLTAGANP